MKKLLSLVLALAMMLMVLASCDNAENNPCEGHVDENHDFICDICEEALPNNGLNLMQSLVQKFSKAKTFRLLVELKSDNTYEGWVAGENGEAVLENDEYHANITVDMVFSLTDEENMNFKANVTIANSDMEDNDSFSAYFVDNKLYAYDSSMDAYIVQDFGEEVAMVKEMLDTILEDVTMEEAKKNELFTQFGENVISTFNLLEGKGSVAFDATEQANATLTYIKELDLTTATAEDVLNKVLALVDKELTVKALEEELARVLALSVNEALAELDAWLTKEYNTTLQGIYDGLVNDPMVAQLIKNIIALQLQNAEGITDIDAEVETIYNEQFKSVKISEMIAEMQVGDTVLFDLIVSMIPNAEEGTALPTLTEFMSSISAILDMTLAQIEETFEISVFTSVKEAVDGIEVNKLAGKLELAFKGLFDLDYVMGDFTMDITEISPSFEFDGKVNKERIAVSASAKLFDISQSATTIAPPTDKESYIDIGGSYQMYDDNGYYRSVDVDYSYEGVNVVVDVPTSGGTVRIETIEPLPLDTLKSTTISIPLSNLKATMTYNSALVLLEGDDLVVVLDIDNGVYQEITFPTIRKTVETVVDEIGTGAGGVDYSDTYDISADFGGDIFDLQNGQGTILLDDTFYLSSISFTYVVDEETGALHCTITYITCDSTHPLRYPSSGSGFYGGTDQEIDAFFGGDVTFTIYMDGTVVCNDGIPTVLDEYKGDI